MRRLLTCGALCVCALVALVSGQQKPTFRGGSESVRVFVTVTDHDGRLATNLTQEQFEVRDEGKPQPITQFDNRPQPIRLIVMLDVSGSMEGNLPLLRAACAQLFARLLRDDGARVGAFGRDITISESFTHDAAELAPRCHRSSRPTLRRRSGARLNRPWRPSGRRTTVARSSSC